MPAPFLKPKFEGDRFNGRKLPLDVLGELLLFEELILDTARWLFMQQNPGRRRLPRGWREGFSLYLTDIEDGSAVPVLVLEETDAPGDIFFRSHFERARDRVIEAIGAAASDGAMETLPPPLRRYFEKIGSGLRDGERIILSTPDASRSVVLDTKARMRLIPRNTPYQQWLEVVGLIYEVDQRAKSYHILDREQRRIFARFDDVHHDRIVEASNAYRVGELFRVRGNGIFNPDGSLREIVETIDIEPEGQRIGQLLEKLRGLEPGWFDGSAGESFPAEALDRLESLWRLNVPASFPMPRFFPTIDGKVSVEWKIDRWDASLEIDPATWSAYFHCLHLDTDEEREAEFVDLSLPNAWEELLNQLSSVQEDGENA